MNLPCFASVTKLDLEENEEPQMRHNMKKYWI